jgi:hypothetical protein
MQRMTNHEMKSAPAIADQGEGVRFRSDTGETLLAGLSPEHLQACKDAARLGPLLNLQLALLLAQREKRK